MFEWKVEGVKCRKLKRQMQRIKPPNHWYPTDEAKYQKEIFKLRHTPPSDMVVITSITTTTNTSLTHIYTLTCNPSTTSLRYFRHLPKTTNSTISRSSNGVVVIKSYMEDSNTISGFANKVIGALPVIGLVARILTDTGGVGGDFIDFAEFRRRVGRNASVNDSRAFIDFQDRRGKVPTSPSLHS